MAPPRGIRVSGLKRVEIERKARSFRERMSLPLDGKLDVGELWERLPDLWVSTPKGELQITAEVDYLPPGIKATSRFVPERKSAGVVISEPTYLGLLSESGPCRFTVCHEIGHIDLHMQTLIGLAQIPHHQLGLHRGKATHEHYRDTEWQADAFAASLLTPAIGLARLRREDRLTREQVAEEFGVSLRAAEIAIDTFFRYGRQLMN